MDPGARTRTLILVNLASILERADEALLPAVYKEVGQVLQASPFSLGALTFYRALVQALASPLAAYLALRHNRAAIIGFGAVWWGAATFAVGVSSSYWAVAAARAANGVGLAVVVPAIQSVVADCHVEEHRGLGFGWLHAAGQGGTILGGLFATLMASGSFLGLTGWRVAFHVVAAVSVLLGLAVFRFAQDPRPLPQPGRPKMSDLAEESAWHFWEELAELRAAVRQVSSLRTFQVIVAQGVVGQTPWNAMVFFTFWLELMGFSHSLAALLVALLSVGNMVGSLWGGWLGDRAALRFPNVGRIFCAQFSAGVAIPLSAILLGALPESKRWAKAYGALFFTMGFLISWNSPACNWPIFSEIVPARMRTTVYALDMALEKAIAAMGAPLVGLLAEKLYGFKGASVGPPHGGSSSSSSPTENDLENARSLAKGLFLAIAVPFALCVILISGLYWTYPKDRERARVESWVEESARAFEMVEAGFDGDSESEGKGRGSLEADRDWWSSKGEGREGDRGTESPPVSLRDLELRVAGLQAEGGKGRGLGEDECSVKGAEDQSRESLSSDEDSEDEDEGEEARLLKQINMPAGAS